MIYRRYVLPSLPALSSVTHFLVVTIKGRLASLCVSPGTIIIIMDIFGDKTSFLLPDTFIT